MTYQQIYRKSRLNTNITELARFARSLTRAMLKHSKASERIASYQFGAKIGPINTSETVATCMCMDLQVKTCEPPSLGKPHPLHLINIILLAGIAKDSLARLCK